VNIWTRKLSAPLKIGGGIALGFKQNNRIQNASKYNGRTEYEDAACNSDNDSQC
jgi:hypothetical protein